MTDEFQIVPSNIRAELDRLGLAAYNTGDWLINDDGRLCQIVSFEYTQGYHKDDPPVVVCVVKTDWGSSHLSLYDLRPDRSGNRKYYRLHDTPESVEREAILALAAPPKDENDTPDPTQTAITAPSSAERMKVIASQLDDQHSRVMVLRYMVERKLNGLRAEADKMMKRLTYTRRVIALLETYLGVYEKIITIRDGEAAPASTPITIRQLILHMDEEVGSIDEQYDGQIGIDFKNVEKFDDWLLKDDAHVQAIVPEQKCIVALRPSQQDRRYSDNPFDNTDDQNRFTYLLIRNGEKIFRVWANMKIGGDRLFPSSETMEKLVEAMSKEDLSEDQTLELKGQELDWQRNAVLLEGLLDRTGCLKPTAERVSLFDHASYAAGRLLLVRDAEQNALEASSGRLSFQAWKKEVNARIGRGSRILLTRFNYTAWKDENWRDYFQNWDWRSPPEFPSPGIHVIDEVVIKNRHKITVTDYLLDEDGHIKMPPTKTGEHVEERMDEYLKFLYMPGGYSSQVWVKDPIYVGMTMKEREKRIGFYVGRNDDNVFNYDEVDLESVRYYINSRIERRNYQKVLPILYGIRKLRLEEQEYERPFVRLIASELDCDEALVWDAVFWWKYKVISHRPIAEDEAKAWRMIRQHVKKALAESDKSSV